VGIVYSIRRINFKYQVPGLSTQSKTPSKKTFLISVSTRPLIIFFLFVFSLYSLAGTVGKIEGKIVDAKTGKSLSYVNVIIVGTSLGVDCESDGSYYIMNVPPGEYEIQARGIGYLPLTVKGVVVEAEHSTKLNLKLFSPRDFEGKYVTREADKEIIKMDGSSRRLYSNFEEINEIPMVASLEDYFDFHSGITEFGSAGKGNSRIVVVTDGFFLLDNRLNTSTMVPPLSAVQDVVVMKGGFDAEYGNVSSCVINVTEKEGERDSYHGSANFLYTFPHMPHYGSSIFNPLNAHIRPFVDTEDSLCWKGTSVLPEEAAEEYEPFGGWIGYAASRREVGDTLTPEEWRDLFRYIYRTEGSDSLGQIPGSYGDKEGYMIDFSFGGPFPGVNIITFLISNARKVEPFSLPVTRENYVENKTNLKTTFRLKPGVKLNVKGLFESIETVTRDSREIYSDGKIWAQSGDILDNVAGKDFMYWVDALNPYDIKRYGWGLDFSYNLSPSTYYNFKFFFSKFTHSSIPIWQLTDSEDFRNTTELIYFGNISIPSELPFGYENFTGNRFYYRDLLPADFIFSNFGRAQLDTSHVNTFNLKGEINSQVKRGQELKTGFEVNNDWIHSYLSGGIPDGTGEVVEEIKYRGKIRRAGLYVQDKFSGEDLYAKLGLRLDYYNPSKDNSKWKISPRMSMSFPIREFGKFYFNFGHFYELPETEKLLGRFNDYVDSIVYIGNPQMDIPKVVSYEIGFEKDFFDQYLFHISGYFNDYRDQIGEMDFGDGGYISYTTYTNNVYGEIKGFEFSLRKRYGKLFKGFLAYNLETYSYGKLGYGVVQMKSNPDFRLLLTFVTPYKWGKILKGISASLLYTRTGGNYFSFDPYAADPFSPIDPTYVNNLKWQDENYWDLRLSKNFSSGRIGFLFYAEVNNIFEARYITGDHCFRVDSANTDKLDYLRSLHLPMYREERYSADTLLIGGDDKVGETGKDYIDKPALEYLYYTNPRFLRMGLKVEF
jgi:outer membrane receptor protein involved in Fe transport